MKSFLSIKEAGNCVNPIYNNFVESYI